MVEVQTLNKTLLNIVNICYIPTSGNCFIKYINHLTGKDYMNEFLTFIRDAQRRSDVMTATRIQPFCKKNVVLT